MIEIKFSDYISHSSDRQLNDASDQIIHFIDCFRGFSDLPVNDRVDHDRDVVTGDHRLGSKISELFTKIDLDRTGSKTRPINSARPVHKWSNYCLLYTSPS